MREEIDNKKRQIIKLRKREIIKKKRKVMKIKENIDNKNRDR